MRKLPAFALVSLGAAALGGAAVAASPKTHRMDVRLPDGSVAHVDYVGDVPPKVTFAPRPLDAPAGWGMPMPALGGLDRMFDEINRQTQAMMRQAEQMARQPADAGAPYVAAYGNAPAGGTSATVVSVTNGGGTCTRTTQVVSQGPGKPPKVTTNVSGQCGSADAPSSGAVNPT